MPAGDFQLGEWAVEPRLNRACGPRGHVHLRPKLMDLLAAIAERAGDVASKEELLAEIWGTEYVADSALSAAVTELRHALGDVARTPTLIATVPKQGYRLVGTIRFPFARTAAGLSPEAPAASSRPLFVSRQRELQVLDEWLAGTLSGRGRLGFVTGSAGSGKSMLLGEFARRAAERGVVAVWGQGQPHTGPGDALLPFRDVMSALCGAADGATPAGALERAAVEDRVVSLTARAVLDAGPLLIDTLVPGALLLEAASRTCANRPSLLRRLGALARRRSLESLSSGVAREVLLGQCVAVLAQVASAAPLVVVLDDLQWADAGTIDLLAWLTQRIVHQRVLLLGTFRDTGLHEAAVAPLRELVHEVTRRAGRCEIALDRGQDAAFVDAFLDAEPNRLDARFRAELLALTGGHALFTVELVEDLRARGVLQRDGDGRWAAPAEIELGDLPARVEGVVAGRLHRLPGELRRVLEVGSVEGQSFTAEVLARVLALDAEHVATLLDQRGVRGERLLVPEPVRTMGDRRLSPFRFRHILFQRHLYRTLGEAERAYLHEAVAEATEALLGSSSSAQSVALARHFELARRPARAAHHRRLAGQHALRFGDHAMAVEHFEAGLSSLREVADAGVRDPLELATQLALGLAHFAAEGYASARARAAYSRARELCELVDDGEARTRTLLMLASVHGMHGAPARGVELAGKACASAAARGDRLGVALGTWRQGVFEFFLGRLDDARRHFDELLDFYDPQAHTELWASVGQDPRVTALAWSAVAHGIAGDSPRAARMLDEAVAWARRIDHPLSLAFALGVCAEFGGSWQAEPDQALPGSLARANQVSRAAWAAECRRIAERSGLGLPVLLADHATGMLAVQRGEVEAGLAAAHAAEEALRAKGLATGLTLALAELAGLCVAAGRIEEAGRVLARCAEYASATGERVAEPELMRLGGEVARARGASPAAVEAMFRRAVDLGVAMGAGRWVRRAQASLGRLTRP